MIVPQILSSVASVASVVGLYLIIRPKEDTFSSLEVGFFVAFLIFAVIAIGLQIYNYVKQRPKKYKTPKKIRGYLFKWIKLGGRVAIFTHDMSWVDDDEMKAMLVNKAERNELEIFMPAARPVGTELEKHGARLYVYADLNVIPSSRFTIVNVDRHDSRVAVGGKVGGVHVIREFSIGEHPFFAVAEDLTRIIRNAAHDRRRDHA